MPQTLYSFQAGPRTLEVEQVGEREAFTYLDRSYAIIGCVPQGAVTQWESRDGIYTLNGIPSTPDEITSGLRRYSQTPAEGTRVFARLIDKTGAFITPEGNEPEIIATLPVK